MSKFSKPFTVLALAALYCGAATAGIEEKEPRTKPTKVESMARVVDRDTSSSLRCFQEGKLVYESAGVRPAAVSAGTTVLHAKNGRSIQLIDLKHGICILEHSDG